MTFETAGVIMGLEMRVRQEDENGLVLTLQDGTEVSVRVSGSELFLFVEGKDFVVRPRTGNVLRIGFEDAPRPQEEAMRR